MRILVRRSPDARSGRSHSRPSRRRSGGRSGFSIVELVIAIVLLSIGMLALAGVSVVVMAQVGGAANQTVAASMLQSRFEPMEGRPCAVIEPGATVYRGIEETWTTTTVGGRAMRVRDTVRFRRLRHHSSIGVGTVVSCDP